MGTIKVKKLVTRPCFHTGESGDYCSRCGARKIGLGYGVGSVSDWEFVDEFCTHLGEFGKHCSKCGDRIRS